MKLPWTPNVILPVFKPRLVLLDSLKDEEFSKEFSFRFF